MATETLQVRLLMQSQQYKREARDAASATGAIASQAKTAGTETSRLDRQLGNTGLTMRSAIVGGAAIAGAAVIGFGKDAIRASTDLEESINAVNVVFGDAAAGVLEIGESAADSFGLANSEFNAFAVQFSSFAKTIAQGEGKEVDEVLKGLTGRIADFASVMNIDVDEAAEKFQSGLAGQTEPLRKFGIDVSAAAVNQKALEMGLADTTAELTEGDKVLARYQLIMEQTDATAGDFKNTQDGLANATRTLNANMEDFKARLGSELTPVMGELAASGIQLFDILDPDLDLGWTQRLSAGIQLITGEGSEAVQTYIDQKAALFELSDETENVIAVTEESIGAANRHRGAMRESGAAAGDAAGDMDKLSDSIGDQGGAWDDVITSMEDYEDMIRRLTDPVFAAIDDQRKLEEATKAYQDVIKDPDATVGEHEQAIWDLVQAQLAAEESAAELPEDLQAAADHIAILGDRAGVTRDDLELLRLKIMEFDGLEANSTVRVNVVGGQRITGGNINTDVGIRQHGGPVAAGHPYVVGEAGPELFIPQQSGMVVSNSQMTTGSAVGGGTTYIFYGDVYGDEGFQRRVREANVKNGRLGLG